MELSIRKISLFFAAILVLSGIVFIISRVRACSVASFRIICFDVGKADAFLLETKNGNVLIDTGLHKSGKEIVNYLEEHEITSIDYLIITHFDKDHVGGADSVLRNVEVRHVIQPVFQKESKASKQYVEALQEKNITPEKLTQNDSFSLDDVNFCINPPKQDTYEKKQSNNSSLIISITYGQTSFLFTGDAEDERLQEYLSMDSSVYTFLKVPYHGHYQSVLPELFQTVHPKYAVITSSDKEPEDQKTAEALKAVGCKVYDTRKGLITLISDGKNLQVSQ